MLTNDEDKISFGWSLDSSWTFNVAGRSKKISEIPVEMLSLSETLFKATEEFFIPTRISYSVIFLSADLTPYGTIELDKSKSVNRVVACNEGVSFDMLKKDIEDVETPNGLISYIQRFDISGKTKFVFKDEEEHIGGVYKENGGPYQDQISNTRGLPDLLWVDIVHTIQKGDLVIGPSDLAYYDITFWTITDIWIRDTNMGLANRKNLRNVFKKMYKYFNVVDLVYFSDSFSNKELAKVFIE